MISLSNLPAGLARGHLSSYVMFVNLLNSFRQKSLRKSLCILRKKKKEKRGANSEGARWAEPLTFLSAAVVPTPEPLLLFSICEIK